MLGSFEYKLYFGPPASCRHFLQATAYTKIWNLEQAGKMPAVRFSPFVAHDRLLSPVDEFDVAQKGRTSCIYFCPREKGLELSSDSVISVARSRDLDD